MIRKLVLGLIALAVMATAASVIVVAAAFAVFALAREQFGPAGAAAVVCLAAAVLIALIATILGLQAMAVRRRIDRAPNPMHQIGELLREQPILSLGALAAAATVVLRHPIVLAGILKMVMGRRRPKA